MIQAVGLLGSGAQADEIESFLDAQRAVSFRAVSIQFFNPENPKLINIDNPGMYTGMPVVAAIGAPGVRKDMVATWGDEKNYITVTSAAAYVDSSSSIGEGSVIAPMAVITTNVSIGKHVIVNVGATVSHDVIIGDYVTIGPGVHIAGRVTIGDGVFIGIGASISNNLIIAAGSVIGAGAVVMHDILEKNSVAVGVPARVIRKNEDWLREI